MPDEIEQFIKAFADSLAAGTFVKMTLGNYKGTVEHPQKIMLRQVATKRGQLVAVQSRFANRETVKNVPPAEGPAIVRESLGSGYCSAHLFTTEHDYQLDIGKRSSRLRAGRPTFTKPASVTHDRTKSRLVDSGAYYLKALGVTTEAGDVKASQQDKWRQINKFVETLGHLVDNSTLRERRSMKVVDMGSGKGYLTFAVYDYFTNVRG
jgi:hypothetical protein